MTSKSAIILKSSRRVFTCQINDGPIVEATALGKLLKDDALVTGDEVELMQQDADWIIESLHPRKNFIYRQLLREKKQKIIAANVDAMIIVMSAELPSFKRGLLDRYLVRASQWNIAAHVVFNKMDLYQPKLATATKLAADTFDLDYEKNRILELTPFVYELSAAKPEYQNRFLTLGRVELLQNILGKTVIFLGQSGVGKSKLINQLSDHEFALKSQEIGKVGKGVHTTTWAEMIQCAHFNIIDSPGVRTFSLNDLTLEELIHYMPDLARIAIKCKFSNCGHQHNTKGCAFYGPEVLSLNPIQQEIIYSRLGSYHYLQQDLLSESEDYKKEDH